MMNVTFVLADQCTGFPNGSTGGCPALAEVLFGSVAPYFNSIIHIIASALTGS